MKHGRTAAQYALPVVRFVGLHVLTLNTPVGRKVAPAFKAHAAPLIRTKSKDLAAAGVRLAPRVAGVENGSGPRGRDPAGGFERDLVHRFPGGLQLD